MRGGAVAITALTLIVAACNNGPNSSVDPAVMRMAKEAMPLAQGLERCRASYRSYPPNPQATIGCIPRIGPVSVQGHFVAVGDWLISPDASGAGYTMSRHVDARSMLLRRCVQQDCRWIFDPGDGKPSVDVNVGA